MRVAVIIIGLIVILFLALNRDSLSHDANFIPKEGTVLNKDKLSKFNNAIDREITIGFNERALVGTTNKLDEAREKRRIRLGL